jgi:hypothetical protein
MNKIWLFLMVFGFNIDLVAQKSDTLNKYPLPEGIMYASILKPLAKEKIKEKGCIEPPLLSYEDTLEYLGCQYNTYIDGFYPIGWSKEGVFAYARYLEDGVQLTDYEVQVIDYKKKEGIVGFWTGEDYDGLKDMWQEEKRGVEEALDHHQIIPNNSLPFEAVQGLAIENSGYALKLKVDKAVHPRYDNNFVQNYQLKMKKSNGSEVIIADYEYRGKKRKYSGIQIAGVLKSPYHKKGILVLSCQEYLNETDRNFTFKLIVINW